MSNLEPVDPWLALRQATKARIGIARAGDALRTSDTLSIQLAHARARDAVHEVVDFPAFANDLRFESITVSSQAQDRATYLRRPDLGRTLSASGRQALEAVASTGSDVTIVLGDGLSSSAVKSHGKQVLEACHEALAGLTIGTTILAKNARVALGDEIGEILNAQLLIMLIGERPGLSTPDSLGIYITWNPKRGRKDSERNCISNIHAAGLGYLEAAQRVKAIVDAARQSQLTGVALKAPEVTLQHQIAHITEDRTT